MALLCTLKPETRTKTLEPALLRFADQRVILVADDDADYHTIVREAFTEAGLGARVVAVTTGAEALEYLRRAEAEVSARPGLLVIDLRLPDMAGHDLIGEIHARPEWRDVPVIALTASTNPDDLQLACEEGAAAVVTKPSGFAELVTALSNLQHLWRWPGARLRTTRNVESSVPPRGIKSSDEVGSGIPPEAWQETLRRLL